MCRCCFRGVRRFSYWFDNLGLITEGNTYCRYTASSLPLWGNTDVVLADINVHLGAVEEHGRRILELVISNEIANLELEIALQMYRERVDRLDERLHEFRQSQELP